MGELMEQKKPSEQQQQERFTWHPGDIVWLDDDGKEPKGKAKLPQKPEGKRAPTSKQEGEQKQEQ